MDVKVIDAAIAVIDLTDVRHPFRLPRSVVGNSIALFIRFGLILRKVINELSFDLLLLFALNIHSFAAAFPEVLGQRVRIKVLQFVNATIATLSGGCLWHPNEVLETSPNLILMRAIQ